MTDDEIRERIDRDWNRMGMETEWMTLAEQAQDPVLKQTCWDLAMRSKHADDEYYD